MKALRRWRPLAALLCIAATVQAIIVHRAALTALDSLRSVAAAEALLRSPTWKTLAEEPEPPLFPVWLATVHQVRSRLAEMADWPNPQWARSAQWAASLPMVAWVAPLYLMTRRFFGRRTAWMTGLLGCLLPAAARLGAEGIPDALFLCLFTVALSLLSRDLGEIGGQTTRRAVGVMGGALLALAILVRVEAAMLLFVIAAGSLWSALMTPDVRGVLPLPALASLVQARHRAVCIGLLLVLGPWLWVCGAITPGTAFTRLTSRGPAREGWKFNQIAASAAPTQAVLVQDNQRFNSTEPGASTRRRGVVAGTVATLDEFLVATGYLLAPLAWPGMRHCRVPRRRAWNRTAVAGVSAWLAVGFANAAATGYLSSRHLLPAAVFLLPTAGHALCRLRQCLDLPVAGGFVRRWFATLIPPRRRYGQLSSRGCVAGAVLLAWGGVCLRPLHADRAGHRAAGEWLAKRDGLVLDTWGWTALISGRETYRYDAAREAFHDARLEYVVVEQRELESGSRRAATLRRLLGDQAECLARFAPAGGQSPVLIFHWRPVLAHNVGPETVRR